MTSARLRTHGTGVIATVAATALLTSVLAPVQHRVGLLNEGLLLLLLTLAISAVWGWQVGLFAAVVTNLALNFFFVAPLHRLTVQDASNVVALVVFLIVSVIGGSLLSSARAAAAEAHRSAAETTVLLDLARAMVGQREPHDALASLCREVVRALNAPGAAVLSGAGTQWHVHASAGAPDAARAPDSNERAIAEQALGSRAVARLGHTGLSTTRRPRIVRPAGTQRIDELAAGAAFVPLRIGDRTLGVLRVDGPIGESAFRDRPDRLLAAFASEAAQGVQRAELAQAAAHAEALMQADEMKTALMTSISHDLKTPLAGIKTSVSSLLDGAVNWSENDRRAFLETIDSQADRLNRVISDILDLNRIESGVITPNRQPVDAHSLLVEARARTALVTSGREVTVEAEPFPLLADESLMLQALVNLVENAAKYSTPGGAIHLRAERDDGKIRLSVEDEGPGIAAEDLPHVFDRFYRAAEQSRRVKGSGLGLAIVKGFVALSGGSVHVESETGATRFVITLLVAAHTMTPA
ncbi:MAG TPA: ATP-binding protein [Dehalococcoidia bacterium]|nr:ATP-binding protein [Dehalococcoidia bacterium]